MELYEFYNLGFGEVLPISSVHGHGTGDLLDAVCAHLDFSETVVEEDRIARCRSSAAPTWASPA